MLKFVSKIPTNFPVVSCSSNGSHLAVMGKDSLALFSNTTEKVQIFRLSDTKHSESGGCALRKDRLFILESSKIITCSLDGTTKNIAYHGLFQPFGLCYNPDLDLVLTQNQKEGVYAIDCETTQTRLVYKFDKKDENVCQTLASKDKLIYSAVSNGPGTPSEIQVWGDGGNLIRSWKVPFQAFGLALQEKTTWLLGKGNRSDETETLYAYSTEGKPLGLMETPLSSSITKSDDLLFTASSKSISCFRFLQK